MNESNVAETESCEVDFMTAVCLVRRRPGEVEGFDSSKFVRRSSFLPKRDLVISNLLTYKEGLRSEYVGR